MATSRYLAFFLYSDEQMHIVDVEESSKLEK
jgi:hypothetical protein